MPPVQTTKQGEIVRNGNNGSGETQAAPSLVGFMEKHAPDFARVLPKHMTPERMTRLAISAVRTTRHLDKCTLPSFASAMMACSTLGLEPNTPLGHAYLIPFKNNKRGGIYECQVIIGYKGLTELMYRSGIVASVKCNPVFEGDVFSYELGLHPDIIHKPSQELGRYNPSKLTHVYPVVRLREQGLEPIWDVLARDQIEQRRRRSKSAASSTSPWVSDYIPMAQKTGIRSIATWVPSSAERTAPLAAAIAYEEANERGKPSQALAAIAGVSEQAQESAYKLGFPQGEDDEEESYEGEPLGREPGDEG